MSPEFVFITTFVKVVLFLILLVIMMAVIGTMSQYYIMYYQERHEAIIVNFEDATKILNKQKSKLEKEGIPILYRTGLICANISAERPSDRLEYNTKYALRVKGCIISIDGYHIYLYPISCIKCIIELNKLNKHFKKKQKVQIKENQTALYEKLMEDIDK